MHERSKTFCDTIKEKNKLELKEVDIPEMKMEPLLQIQENMLKNP